jgi:hypothetical protein
VGSISIESVPERGPGLLSADSRSGPPGPVRETPAETGNAESATGPWATPTGREAPRWYPCCLNVTDIFAHDSPLGCHPALVGLMAPNASKALYIPVVPVPVIEPRMFGPVGSISESNFLACLAELFAVA